MLFGANEVELGKQWANNKLLTSLSEDQDFLRHYKKGPIYYNSLQTN